MTTARGDEPVIVLVPGAWMGAWIWSETIDRLRELGHHATALTLPGLEQDTPGADAAAVTLDDWGPDKQQRRDEKDQVRNDGMLWTPPPDAALDAEADLAPTHRRWLASRFVAQPGRTVLDAATMSRPIVDQPVTFIATAPTGEDPRADLPPELHGETPRHWQLRTMAGGHWPMLTNPDDLIAHVDGAVIGS